ncbi:TPA: DUF131 domain-containing protein [Thermoplasmata archaeon]|nr:DUF131 domain-containing protein [Thermoplasmata archaeon]
MPLSLFIAGIAAVAAAVATGEAEVSLFLVFPVFSGSSGLFMLGVCLIVLAILAGFVMMLQGSRLTETSSDAGTGTGDEERGHDTRVRTGGVLLIGPIPIAYGSDARMAFFMLVIAAIVIAAAILLFIF